MDYLTDRVGKLKKISDGIKWDANQSKFVESMLDLLSDLAVMADDLSDAADELDMRLIEIEQSVEGAADLKPE